MGLSDIELVKKFKQGDDHAFEILVEKYQHKVYNTTFRILGNHQDALDIAQESFIRVYKNLNKFKGNSSFSTWLFRISTNLCRDELRKRQRGFTECDIEENDYEIKEKNNPENISLKKEFNDELQEQISTLPLEQKTVLVLREFQGLSYKEIANILNISMGTVKSRLSRARQTLRDSLNDIINEGGIK
ncbi:RNA polymerase sigma factor [Natronospora cellulosivora (SeqCode)]